MAKFREIIDRVEQVRQSEGLNKSKFCVRIGMRPQTYNNFTGVQASKPSIELVAGVAREFGVTADWLLTGEEIPPTRSSLF